MTGIPTWFLYVAGFSLLLLGIMQMAARPRKADDSLFVRFVNVGTLWSLVCITVGTVVVAMALGYVDWNRPAPPPKKGLHWKTGVH